jgi:hypothetical protein
METLKLIALIYWVGYIVAYISMRLVDGTSENWGAVRSKLFLGLLSWVAVLVILLNLLFDLEFFKKPPRWL